MIERARFVTSSPLAESPAPADDTADELATVAARGCA
jgi:hypothetical protein